jgi:CheY-like chemotaxis protein
VHDAANGREGYALLAAHPDLTLVLLDLNMPEMNGLEVLARRQAEHLHPYIPVALVTTEGSEEDEARGRAVGAWDYLRKPFQPSDIQGLVRRARELRRSRGAA